MDLGWLAGSTIQPRKRREIEGAPGASRRAAAPLRPPPLLPPTAMAAPSAACLGCRRGRRQPDCDADAGDQAPAGGAAGEGGQAGCGGAAAQVRAAAVAQRLPRVPPGSQSATRCVRTAAQSAAIPAFNPQAQGQGGGAAGAQECGGGGAGPEGPAGGQGGCCCLLLPAVVRPQQPSAGALVLTSPLRCDCCRRPLASHHAALR